MRERGLDAPAQGIEWLVDAHGCRPAALRDRAVLAALFAALVRDLELKPVGEPRFHVFPPPGGVTGMLLLSESHLTCHTFPETGLCTLNLYCCRPRPEWPWGQRLMKLLDAQRVEVMALPRPGSRGEP
jgi:S-adenosylmethionine decarboxylase